MSECVVRMEMPKGCGSCPIANFGYCSINHEQVGDPLMGYPENRPANCPIICQLPEWHGRLVDGDMPVSEVRKWVEVWDCDCSENGKQTVMAVDDLYCLPTIVPAAERSET